MRRTTVDIDDDMMDMSMQMTFSSWCKYYYHDYNFINHYNYYYYYYYRSTYQVSIVFSSWNVTTKTQYFFSWLFIVLLTILYHIIRYMINIISISMTMKRDMNQHKISGNNNTSSSNDIYHLLY